LVLHFFDGNELLHSTANASDLIVPDVYLFAVQIGTVWVFPHIHNLAHSDIHLCEIGDHLGWLGLLRIWLGLLWLLLLLGLFGLLVLFFLTGNWGRGFSCSLRGICLFLISPLGWCLFSLRRLLLFLLFGLEFGEFLHLRLGGGLDVFIREGNEEVVLLDQLEEAGQVLQVVNPTEQVGGLDLLVVFQFLLRISQNSFGLPHDQ
jgi:hypothetical protein